MSIQKQYYTLRQVVQSIRATIEQKYTGAYWIKAEMHKLNKYPSGHCFPELLEKVEGKIVAEMRATIWAHNFEKINKKFIEVVKEPLKEDTTLLLLSKVTFHETYGLSLQILDIDPSFTLGELQKEKRDTLNKLQKLGILNANQSLLFPDFPKRIAIISGDSSKGLSDFNKVLEDNIQGYSFFTMLFPAYLQGDHTKDSIKEALNKIRKVKHHFDVVVIVRGGGGEVGLSCFNNFELCKELASFPLPVLTGIGHSTNFTVAEMIANKSAITPTELGGIFISAFDRLNEGINIVAERIKTKSIEEISRRDKELDINVKDFRYHAIKHVRNSKQEVSMLSYSLINSSRIYQMNEYNTLKSSVQSLQSQFGLNIKKVETKLNEYSREVHFLSGQLMRDGRKEIEKLEHMVRLVDPKNVLKRGYTISTVDGVLVRKAQIKAGSIVITKTDNAEIHSEVINYSKNE